MNAIEGALLAQDQVALPWPGRPLAELLGSREPAVCCVWWPQGESESSPYLVRPDRAGGDLLNGQGLLQLRAQRCAVVAAATRPGPPATRYKDWVTRGNPRGCLSASGKSRVRTCRATPEGSTVPKVPQPPSPWPRLGSRERPVAGPRQEGRRMLAPPPTCRGERKSGREASRGLTRLRLVAARTVP